MLGRPYSAFGVPLGIRDDGRLLDFAEHGLPRDNELICRQSHKHASTQRAQFGMCARRRRRPGQFRRADLGMDGLPRLAFPSSAAYWGYDRHGGGGLRLRARRPAGAVPPVAPVTRPVVEQISWPTAERAAPDLACIAPVGYSVRAWIDGKEKVYGSIP